MSPTFLTINANCSSGAGNRCVMSSDPDVDGQLAAHLNERASRRKRPSHEHVRPADARERRGPLQEPGASRAGRHIEREGR